nr:putative ribonuclease h protein [Quercus suber]
MEMEYENDLDPNSSSTGAMKSTWNRIWQVEVPNRIRLLLWRAGTDSLPSRANLLHRKLLTENMCLQCKTGPEDTLHALWTCPQLTTVWQVYFADLIEGTNSASSFLDVIQLAQQDPYRFALFAWMSSMIWMRRNKLRMQEDTAPLAKTSSMACEALQEYNQLRPTHEKLPRTARSIRWCPPPIGLLKVNFDGALFAEENIAGLGIIIRNESGLVMAALTQQIPLPASVKMVEVLVARRALWFAKELGFHSLIVKGDLEIIINSINGDNMAHSEFGHILQDIKFLYSFFNCISFQHIRRQGNGLAHKLARRAIPNPFEVWMEFNPPNAVDVYNFDLQFST